jgi:TetR/AcrR family transcriptional regulator
MPTPKTRSAAPRRTSPPAPRTRRDGDTERRILEAARRVFTRHGTAGARMQEIAAEAAVNQALLHYYFRTKDALALAVFREAAGRLFPELLRIVGQEAPLEARITQVVHHYIDTLREHPFLPGYVLAEIHFHPERIPALAREMASPGAPNPVVQALACLDRDLRQRAEAGAIRPMRADQFLVNLASLCVFPFAARPMLAHLLSINPEEWDAFLNARRAELPGFILNALRP